MSWNGYWEIYGDRWASCINKLATEPDEILIISDAPIDISNITITNNIKNIVLANPPGQARVSHYRNVAVDHSSSDWVVASDIDDTPFANYIDNLDDEADIHAFSFTHDGVKFYPDKESLADRLATTAGKTNIIPGTSAIKKYFFKNLKYENDCHEDHVFYSMAYSLSPKVSFDKSIRFDYSGWHNNKEETNSVTQKYKSMLLGKDRNLFVCWFSDSITDGRRDALKNLASYCNVDIKLITNKTFYNYENKEIEIHRGFRFLSDVHKSDYARAYLMYFHGGGYSDIKANEFDWNPYFDQLLSSKYDAIGAAERSSADVANFWGRDVEIEAVVHNRYSEFASCGSFIFKPRTKFAYDWITRIHEIMDGKYEQLRDNPGLHPYTVNGGIHASYSNPVPPEMINADYPFAWTAIGGTIRHRLEYEYGLNVFKKGMPFPNTKDYR